jgi:solute carrier family 25 (mitochondrial phosphate transporter), member 23/24/25/41
MSGAVSSTCGQIVAYPMALVRTRLQAQGMDGNPVLYSGTYDCLRTTVRQEGVRGLYRGIMANFLKAIPAISISYVVYEHSKQVLSGAL